MISTTFNGESVYLLNERANWTPGFTAFFSRMTVVEGSQQGLEARQPMNNALRTRLQFQIVLDSQENADFRVGLQRLKNKRVLCPFWPGAHNYYNGGSVYISTLEGYVYITLDEDSVYISDTGEAPRINAGIWLTFEQDWSTWEIHTTDTPVFTPSATAVRVPLLLGYFESDPDPTPVTDELLKCTIKFRQDSPGAYSLKPLNVTSLDGPALGARTPQLMPVRPNWAKPITAGGSTVEKERNEIGFGGEAVEVYYPQNAKRGMQMGFTLFDWSDIAQLINFFHKRGGPVESFWIPGALAECKLAAASSGSSANITVDHAAGLGDNIYLAFVSPTGTPVLRRVVSVNTTTNVVTLDSAPGVFQPGQVSLVSLILARFKKSEIEVRFDSDLIAFSQIAFVETSDEYATATGETIGTTYGALPAKAFLYRFYRRFPSGTVIDRFTSWEGSINASGEIFTSHKGHFDHNDIEDSLDIERTTVKVRSRAFEGNPLLLFLPNTLEVPLELEILECSPDATNIAGAPHQLFIGEVTGPNQTGPKLTCQVTHKLATLLGNVPTMMVQPTCPYKLYSTPCGLAESDWRFTATVVSYSSSAATLVIGSITRGAGVPTLSAAWFRYGKVTGGTGTGSWLRSVYDSTAISGGNVTLTLSMPLTPAPSVGSTVYVNPGCTGTVEECRDKFLNFPKNFGGSMFVPNGDPSFGEAPRTGGTGKK